MSEPFDVQKQIFLELSEIRSDVKKLIESVAGLKVKAGIWGVFGGVIVAIPVLFAVWRMTQG